MDIRFTIRYSTKYQANQGNYADKYGDKPRKYRSRYGKASEISPREVVDVSVSPSAGVGEAQLSVDLVEVEFTINYATKYPTRNQNYATKYARKSRAYTDKYDD